MHTCTHAHMHTCTHAHMHTCTHHLNRCVRVHFTCFSSQSLKLLTRIWYPTDLSAFHTTHAHMHASSCVHFTCFSSQIAKLLTRIWYPTDFSPFFTNSLINFSLINLFKSSPATCMYVHVYVYVYLCMFVRRSLSSQTVFL